MIIKAKKRDTVGKKVKKLRREGSMPAVIYQSNKKSINVVVEYTDFIKMYRQAGETEIVTIKVDDKEYATLIDEVQLEPISLNPIHANFRLVNLKEKISVEIPIEYVGEEKHPLIKNQTAILITQYNEIEVEALPTDLPKEIEVSIDSLKEIGDTLTIKDLKQKVDASKVQILEEDEDIVIASLDYAQQPEIEEEEEERSVEDIEITSESKKDEEGEEGEEKPKEAPKKPEGEDKKEE